MTPGTITHAVAIERRPTARYIEVMDWLEGQGSDNWEIEYDYDLINLHMTDQLYVLYKLRWQ